MNKSYVYSINNDSIARDKGTMGTIEFLSKLAEGDSPEMISEIFEKEYIIPMMSINNKGSGSLSDEQLDHLVSMSGKTATMSNDDDFQYTKELMDRPFWSLGENAIIVSNDDILLLRPEGTHQFSTTQNIVNKIERDFPNGEPHSYLSMRHNDFRNSYQEASELVSNEESSESLFHLLEQSDRKTRLAITSNVINASLGLLTEGQKDPVAIPPEEALDVFEFMDKEWIEEYKDMLSMSSVTSFNNSSAKVVSAIDHMQDALLERQRYGESNPDYVENVLYHKVEELLKQTQGISETQVIENICDFSSNEEVAPVMDERLDHAEAIQKVMVGEAQSKGKKSEKGYSSGYSFSP